MSERSLECGSLLPPCRREACFPIERNAPAELALRPQSGSKLPHSMISSQSQNFPIHTP